MEIDVIVELFILVAVIAIMCYLYYDNKKNKADADKDTAEKEQSEEPLLINCPVCRSEVSRYAPNCPKCGQPICLPASQQATILQSSKTNGIGMAGFVTALLSWIFIWALPISIVLWFFGILFSTIGLFKRPRGFAVAGFIMTTIVIVIAIILMFFSGVGITALVNYLTI